MTITTEEELRNLYGWPSGRAKRKVLKRLEKQSNNFLNYSPFFVLSSYDKNGLADASPRGGKPGFVQVIDDKTLLIPDAKGNNRVDSLVNIIETGRVACLFMIPGIDECLRINGTAIITTNNEHLDKFQENKNPPKTCIEITIKEVFLHCAKALMRSELWNPTLYITRPSFPTMGEMLHDQLKENNEIESQNDMTSRYKKDI